MKLLLLLAVFALVSGCASDVAETAVDISDEELAWCLTKPGAVGAAAADSGSAVPAEAQAVADEGIYEDAGRWAFHDAWGNVPAYNRFCALAYVQFDGAEDEVDLAILEPEARIVSPEPTGNVATDDLRQRAAELIPQMETAGAELVAAIRSGDTTAMASAADRMRAITGPEYDALTGAVAEPCYVDAGAAYGMTLFAWDAVANDVNRYLDEGDPALLDLAIDFAGDAAEGAAEWRELDAGACG